VEEPGHATLVSGTLLHHILCTRHHLTGLLLCVLRLRSRRHSAGVECRRSSGRPNGVLVDLLQKEVIANFKKVREQRGVPDDGPEVLEVLVEEILGGGYFPLKVSSGGLFLLQEQAGGLHTMTCSGSLGFNGLSVLDKSIEPLLKGLGLQVQRHGREEVATPTRGCDG
jgi:hypothetical protein